MQTNVLSVWPPRLVAFLMAGLAAASVVFWTLRISGKPADLNASVIATGTPVSVDPAAVARAMGWRTTASPTVPSISLAGRFSMVGVLADTYSGGAALIVVDGAPPKPFRVGAVVAEGLVLQSVTGRIAALASERDGPVLLTLELPPLKR